MKMKYYYSPSTKGFYVDVVHGTKIPRDVVMVTAEAHEKLTTPTPGMIVTYDERAKTPKLVPAPPPPPEIQEQRIRNTRDQLLRDTDGPFTRHQEEVLLQKTTTLTPVEFGELVAYRQALRDLTAVGGFPFVTPPTAPTFLRRGRNDGTKRRSRR